MEKRRLMSEAQGFEFSHYLTLFCGRKPHPVAAGRKAKKFPLKIMDGLEFRSPTNSRWELESQKAAPLTPVVMSVGSLSSLILHPREKGK